MPSYTELTQAGRAEIAALRWLHQYISAVHHCCMPLVYCNAMPCSCGVCCWFCWNPAPPCVRVCLQNHQIDQLKEEISGKDLALVKEHFDHMKVCLWACMCVPLCLSMCVCVCACMRLCLSQHV